LSIYFLFVWVDFIKLGIMHKKKDGFLCKKSKVILSFLGNRKILIYINKIL